MIYSPKNEAEKLFDKIQNQKDKKWNVYELEQALITALEVGSLYYQQKVKSLLFDTYAITEEAITEYEIEMSV